MPALFVRDFLPLHHCFCPLWHLLVSARSVPLCQVGCNSPDHKAVDHSILRLLSNEGASKEFNQKDSPLGRGSTELEGFFCVRVHVRIGAVTQLKLIKNAVKNALVRHIY